MNERNILMPPNIQDLKRVLFVQPHPDDNEIGAGGTILKLRSWGCEVFELTVTDGAKGWADCSTPSVRVACTREKEAEESQKILGMKNAGFLRFEDQTDASVKEIGDKIADIVDEIQPDGVFTVDPNLRDEWHDDHIKTGKATLYAVKNCAYPVKVIGYYFTDLPNTYVDVTEWQEKKWKAISKHKSQMNEEMIILLEEFFMANRNSEDKYVESLRVLGRKHMHCWSLPFTEVCC